MQIVKLVAVGNCLTNFRTIFPVDACMSKLLLKWIRKDRQIESHVRRPGLSNLTPGLASFTLNKSCGLAWPYLRH